MKEEYDEHPYSDNLDSPVVNSLSHFLLLSIYTHTHTHIHFAKSFEYTLQTS